ncbi:MAG: exodeoxyribonuclease V subunit gamma [Aquabacterium sp.]|nr:exodeoxyribonuclease V subunit gamma [Aquabacterium sp.]
MLTLHFANRQETLSDLLTSLLAQPGGDLFTPDEVVVPSTAVRRAVTLQLAQRHGVCANLRFGYLAPWLWAQGTAALAAAAPGTPLPVRTADIAQAPWQPARITWRVLAAFDDAAWVAAHPRLARYLAQADAVTRLDLAQRVAAQVDQHITYRPDWLAAWTAGRSALPADTPDEAWQAALWRRLQTELAGHASGPVDPTAAHSLATALAQAGDGTATRARLQQSGLPASAHVFCLPTIAPVHLALLQQLARWVDLHVYALNPCAEYWFDVVDPRRLARLAAAGKAQHLEVGHRLLAAWGQQAQAQLAALVDASGDGVVDDDHYQPALGGTLLATLQNSILTLQDLDPASLLLDATDRSITLHVCHSLTRELEVLHDALLARMTEPDPPAPGDILVVLPDLEAAAPVIDSVFGTAPAALALPFTITGRAQSQVNPAARALLDALALAASRGAASAVFGLLQQPVVAARFGLDDDGLARVHGWLLDAGVHWAFDGAQRAVLGLGGDGVEGARHSWADGLDRLFLGHALPGSAAPFDGRLPAGEAEGSAALALGALWSFLQTIDALRRQTASALPAQDWPPLLSGVVDSLLHANPSDLGASADALADLRAAIQGLADTWAGSTPTLPLVLDVVRQALTQALDDPARGGVPTGRITFSALPSLRSLPYRMVCVLGLNDGAFPSANRPAEFDLIAQHPRPGDRQRRQDERNLFLDLLLAARERLYLSHTGRSVRDNSHLPPSVLVSELLDTLVPAIAAPRAAVLAHLVVQHPLQAFDVRGFQPAGDVRLRSFHAEYAAALAAGQAAARAQVLATPAPADDGAAEGAPDDAGTDANADATTDGPAPDSPAPDAPAPDDSSDEADTDLQAAAPAFFTQPLPAPAPATITLVQLQRFFRHPARALLQRLGLTLRQPDETLADDEPFLPDYGARQDLADRLLPTLLQAAQHGSPVADAALLARAQAGTRLPAGPVGRQFIDAELPLLRAHAQAVAAAGSMALLLPHSATLAFTVDVDGQPQPWPLAITLTGLHADGLLRHRYDDPRPADHLAAWLDHLALCACAPAGVAGRTRWLGRGAHFGFQPVDDPLPLLQALLGLFVQGQRQPLAFFPKTAWAWMAANRSLGAARAAWLASARRPFAEQADAAHRLVQRGRPDPLEGGLADFEAVSAAVLAPLFAHLDDGDGA